MAEREPPDLDHVREELHREHERESPSPPTRREETPPERVREAVERLEPDERGDEE